MITLSYVIQTDRLRVYLTDDMRSASRGQKEYYARTFPQRHGGMRRCRGRRGDGVRFRESPSLT